MTTACAIACLISVGSQKNIKIWKEPVKYLPSVDRARVLRHNGSVLTLNMVALKEEMEKGSAG